VPPVFFPFLDPFPLPTNFGWPGLWFFQKVVNRALRRGVPVASPADLLFRLPFYASVALVDYYGNLSNSPVGVEDVFPCFEDLAC